MKSTPVDFFSVLLLLLFFLSIYRWSFRFPGSSHRVAHCTVRYTYVCICMRMTSTILYMYMSTHCGSPSWLSFLICIVRFGFELDFVIHGFAFHCGMLFLPIDEIVCIFDGNHTWIAQMKNKTRKKWEWESEYNSSKMKKKSITTRTKNRTSNSVNSNNDIYCCVDIVSIV